MTALPPSTDFTGSSVTEGGFKTAISSMRTFIADFLGTDSSDQAGTQFGSGINHWKNASLEHWQRGTTVNLTSTTETYLSDSMAVVISGSPGATTWSKGTSAGDYPTKAEGGSGIPVALKFNPSVAYTFANAGDFFILRQRFNGNKYYEIRNKTVTFSWFFKAPTTGTYSVAIRTFNSSAQTAVYVTSATYNTANTMQQMSVTVDLSGSTGAIATGANWAAEISMCLGGNAGGTFEAATNNAWVNNSTVKYYAAGQANAFSGATNNTYISDIQLKVANSVLEWTPSADVDEHLKYYFRLARDIGDDNAYALGDAHITSATNARMQYSFPIEMNGVPTIEISAVNAISVFNASSTLVSTAIALLSPKSRTTFIDFTVATGTFTAGDDAYIQLNASDSIAFSSELS